MCSTTLTSKSIHASPSSTSFLRLIMKWLKKAARRELFPRFLDAATQWTFSGKISSQWSLNKPVYKSVVQFFLLTWLDVYLFFLGRNVICLPFSSIKISAGSSFYWWGNLTPLTKPMLQAGPCSGLVQGYLAWEEGLEYWSLCKTIFLHRLIFLSIKLSNVLIQKSKVSLLAEHGLQIVADHASGNVAADWHYKESAW